VRLPVYSPQQGAGTEKGKKGRTALLPRGQVDLPVQFRYPACTPPRIVSQSCILRGAEVLLYREDTSNA